jgi:hypothetical protein
MKRVSIVREKSVGPLLPGTGPSGASHKRGPTLIFRSLISQRFVQALKGTLSAPLGWLILATLLFCGGCISEYQAMPVEMDDQTDTAWGAPFGIGSSKHPDPPAPPPIEPAGQSYSE